MFGVFFREKNFLFKKSKKQIKSSTHTYQICFSAGYFTCFNSSETFKMKFVKQPISIVISLRSAMLDRAEQLIHGRSGQHSTKFWDVRNKF